MNTRTRPERNLETLEHEPKKCDWKTTDTQKMRSRKCRTGPSVCGKRPPNSSIYVSTSEVKTTTEGITTLSSAGLPAWESAGCQPHRKTPRSRKFNSTENMKTTSETETLQQHPQASAERAPRQATRKRREREKEEAAALHTGGGRRWPVLLGCRRKASRSHFGGWGCMFRYNTNPMLFSLQRGLHARSLATTFLSSLIHLVSIPEAPFSTIAAASLMACNPLSQNGYGISAPNENSQKASISVNVLAAGSQDRICVNEHQN